VARALSPSTAPASVLAVGGLLAAALSLTSCGVPPELKAPTSAAVPSPRASAPATPTAGPPTTHPPAPSLPTSPSFNELSAVDCRGNPSGSQVIGLLRRSSGLLTANARVTVLLGPLCSGSWQYTVVQLSDREPLQVVSSGPATALTLVTAGTNVCSIPVRTAAPAGIRTAACEAAPPPAPGD
jgi:hypothetical protein